MHMPSIAHHRKRARLDYIAQRIVVFFGWAVLLMLAILVWHLASNALPLFQSPTIKYSESVNLPAHHEILSVGDLERGGFIISKTPDCNVHFYGLSITRVLQRLKTLRLSCESTVIVALHRGKTFIAEQSSSGILRINEVSGINESIELNLLLSRSLPDGFRDQNDLQLTITQPWVIVQYIHSEQQHLLWIDRLQSDKAFLQSFDTQSNVSPLPDVNMTASLSQSGLSTWSVNTSEEHEHFVTEDLSGFITLTEDPRSVYESQSPGVLHKWSLLNNKGVFELVKLFSVELATEESPIYVSVDASVNLGLVLTDKRRIILFNRVTGEVLHHYALASMPTSLSWFDDYLYIHKDEEVQIWQVKDRDSSTSLSALIEPHLYSGYEQPDYIWQTTSATDYQIAKYSIVPLIIGSLKASLVALLIAVPLALGAAIYTAFFAHSEIRNKVKPTIEMLEAIPSVVIGFIAAVWLSPLAEQFLIALCAFLILMPLTLIIAAFFQFKVLNGLPLALRRHGELPVISLAVAIVASICLYFGLDGLLSLSQSLHGPLSNWLTGTPISKTTLVVAIALGIAISPTIFSLAEDAIDAVPDGLKKASFALGATRLQTLRNVVLKVAFPGIIAALMLGFGRAFGETMIVLMVTGNTPVADWDLLAGLRAMTANLAIELPESEVGSVHYRVLFLTAFLLFLFTFAINTIAEILRLRARKAGAL